MNAAFSNYLAKLLAVDIFVVFQLHYNESLRHNVSSNMPKKSIYYKTKQIHKPYEIGAILKLCKHDRRIGQGCYSCLALKSFWLRAFLELGPKAGSAAKRAAAELTAHTLTR